MYVLLNLSQEQCYCLCYITKKTFPRCHNFRRTLLMTSHQSIKGLLLGIHIQPMYQEKEKKDSLHVAY